ncbi:hypothetical protein PMAYCL1PPCAC_29814, partial [Pristionchus mayeri]
VASMHCSTGSSSFDVQHWHEDSKEDSGLGDSCSSASSAAGDGAPVDFAAFHAVNQKLSSKMESMHIKNRRNEEWKAMVMDLDEGISNALDEDENARDCDSSFSMMPPPAVPFGRRILGDIGNRAINSPVSSKRYCRNETMPNISGGSIGGLRNRKRLNRSPMTKSPFSSMLGKRWKMTEVIEEHSEIASTSFASRSHSMDSSEGSNENALLSSHSSFHRVQSSSVLERGIYAHHHDESLPAPLEVSYRIPRDPALEKTDSDVYRRIGAVTLSEMMRTMGDEFEKSYALIDCRYPYEFEGGHIKGATNVYDPKLIEYLFFSSTTSLLKEKRVGEGRRIPIFYCEFSQKRGPSMALAVRAFDRLRNTWPMVDHSEMYVLNGGYKGFHASAEKNGFGEFCLPFSYIQMEDPQYKAQMDKFRFHKSRNLLSFTSTVSRIAQPTTKEEKQSRRAEQGHDSPISLTRRPSRRALNFGEISSFSSTPPRPVERLPNPQFS